MNFATLRPKRSTISGVNDDAPSLDVEGVGDIHLRCSITGQKDRFITLRGVSYCPKAASNLISGSAIDKAGLVTIIANGKMQICKRKGNSYGDILMVGTLRDRLYEMKCEAVPTYQGKSDIVLITMTKLSLDL